MTGCFSGILYNLDRAADNCVIIAEEALDNQGFVKLGEAAQKLCGTGCGCRGCVRDNNSNKKYII